MAQSCRFAAHSIVFIVFRFERLCCHTSENRRWTKFDEMLEVVRGEKEILCFNPAHWRRKLVGKPLDEDGVGECLCLIELRLVLLLQRLQYLLETW